MGAILIAPLAELQVSRFLWVAQLLAPGIRVLGGQN